ncbi:MAG: bifunctional phosphopantothenoylcysteine decarboxylase/phosphopantothenate--cysteine ligase CoaBC [Proteobacteria bacterium]|nr:bifunctional phosphopantothenoylcysteine decarboxylase/phosphopantothenate--cysteine ligase CoaBC [Pseudomonadota bacterium]
MSFDLAGERILLGVSGGIAAYKAADLVRRLRDAGAQVQVVMTAAAGQFVGAATFQALSGRTVRDSLWDAAAEGAMGHIELARWATRVVIAPASADVLARLAHGRADDLLATLCLATTAPLALAPAMNHRMWLHPATQANMALLQARGAQVLGPDAGAQACGEFGPGRMVEPDAIVAALAASRAHSGDGPLTGRRVLVSAGPTYEDLDPVRYLGNRSSGKMGFAIAAAAAEMGAQVTLVAGPVGLPTPAGVRRIDVRSAHDMHAAVLGALPQDIYIGAAAVADFTPAQVAEHKIKKPTTSDDSGLTLELVRTPDILAAVAAHAQRTPLVVGFAAETTGLADSARDKLARKKVDAIAANRVGVAGSGFDSDDNALDVYWRGDDGAAAVVALGPARKSVLARDLLRLLIERVANSKAATA